MGEVADVTVLKQGLVQGDYGLPDIEEGGELSRRLYEERLRLIFDAHGSAKTIIPERAGHATKIFIDYLSKYIEPYVVEFSAENLTEAFLNEELNKTPGGDLANWFKSKREIPHDVFLRYCEAYQQGTYVPWQGVKPKPELRGMKNGKVKAPRLFYPGDLITNVHQRVLFGPIMTALTDCPAVFIGKTDSYGGWHSFISEGADGWKVNQDCHFYDWSNQDISIGHVIPWVVSALLHFVRLGVGESVDYNDLANRIVKDIVFPYFKFCFRFGRRSVSFGLRLHLLGSGMYLTLLLVTMCALWAHIYLSVELYRLTAANLMSELKLRIMGDDCLRRTALDVETMQSFGVSFDHQVDKVQNLKFCNRKLAFVNFRGMVRCIALPDLKKLQFSLQLKPERVKEYCSASELFGRLKSYAAHAYAWKMVGQPSFWDKIMSAMTRLRDANKAMGAYHKWEMPTEQKCRSLVLGL